MSVVRSLANPCFSDLIEWLSCNVDQWNEWPNHLSVVLACMVGRNLANYEGMTGPGVAVHLHAAILHVILELAVDRRRAI